MCKYCFNSSVRRQSLCQECLQRPREENVKRLAIINAIATLHDFLLQKNISAKNLNTIEPFCESEDTELREFASLVMAIGTRFPRKKKRYIRIRQQEPELYQQLRQSLLFKQLEDGISSKMEFDHRDYAYSQIEAEKFEAEFEFPLDGVPFW